jgi:hypothetical protein
MLHLHHNLLLPIINQPLPTTNLLLQPVITSLLQ